MLKVWLFLLLTCVGFIAHAQDIDSDGVAQEYCVCTAIDNCPDVYNPDQGDCDSDGIGDACDESNGCVDTGTDTDTGTEASFFTIIQMPDTQAYTSWKPSAYYAQTDWIVENAEALNIKFVAHVGDVVGSVTSTTQWDVASNAMQTLDLAGVSYSVSYGNHDGDGRDTTFLNSYFPLSRFESMDTFGDSMEYGIQDNTYHTFSFGGENYIIISLEFGPRDAVLEWAEDVLTEYSEYHAIIVTHSYLNADGERAADGDANNPRYYALGEYNDGQLMWDEMIKYQDNVDLVLCGHIGVPEGSALLTSVSETGKTIHQMLANYQYLFSTDYKSAIRILTFYPSDGTVEASTYSPYYDIWFDDAVNQFSIEF